VRWKSKNKHKKERIDAGSPPSFPIERSVLPPTTPQNGVVIEVSNVCKSFAATEAVKDVSFTVEAGEIFGLVGPNGAGKTTTIRMLMDIIKPDSGEMRLFDEPLGEKTKNRIGYLPEERGLYRKLKVIESLDYLASLKGAEPRLVRERADMLLKRVEMFPHKDKKVEQLSRGMGQLIQFLVTIVHDPDLVVFDEPFAGLDPVNKELTKEMIRELRSQGKAIILSTHMMNEVEELCDRVLMIDRGQVVLYGRLDEIKAEFRNNSIFLEYQGELGELEGVIGSKDHGKYMELFLDGETPPQRILEQLSSRNVAVERFEVSTPSLNEIFIQMVEKGRK
jgi:ABC-2 type transport system ATP-binding protein